MDCVAQTAQVLHRARRIVRSHEGYERNLVLGGEMPEHVVGSYLGPRVERIGQHLGQKENAWQECVSLIVG